MPILKPTAGADFVREHIKPGVYPATLIGVDVFQMPDDKRPGEKKDMLRWSFAITSKKTGETKTFEGVSSLAWGAPAEGRQVAKAWRWVNTILGTTPPDEFNTDDVIGAEVYVKIGDKERNGAPYSVVEDVIPAPSSEGF